ncbi:T9SS type A sorting domain-containing protein [Candidatus Eisenbacteria bacterium]|uniref:T9SS type A sorting domain-containing protein n=1 Tax=Eiseniibacteriota bacterium TaxID=2212470 RepID=A0ABV6YPE5_UNCEI
MSIYPPTTIVDPGDTFTVFIFSDDDSIDYNGYETILRFDSSALAFVSAEEESLMTEFCNNRFWRVRPGPDSIYIGHGFLCPYTNVTGPGALSSLTFEALSEGRTAISADFFWFTRAGIYIKEVTWRGGAILVGPTAGVDEERTGARNAFEIKPNPGRAFDIGVEFVSPAYRDQRASLKVYDVSGRQLRNLWDGPAGGDGLRVHWDGTDGCGRVMPPGIYFLVFSTDSGEEARKLVVVR